jgi:hypothetical protein
METEATWLIHTLERALKDDDPATGWHLQDNISKALNALPHDSEERVKLTALWEQMMIKWH